MNNKNLEYIKKLHRDSDEMIRYTDIESCDKVVMTKEQLKRFENDIQKLRLPVKVKDIEFMRKYVEGGKLKITETNAEYLLEQNPNIFQGINLELVDEDDDDYFEV